MKHNLKISVSDKPQNGGVVACRKISIRKRILDKLLGPVEKVTLIVPSKMVDSISISETCEGGACCE